MLPSDMPISAKLAGVEVKELISHPDQRGFFRELIRDTDPFFKTSRDSSAFGQSAFGQWSHSKMTKDVVKAWHFHHKQTDWWYVPLGKVHVALVDNRPESPTYKQVWDFYLGDTGDYGSEVNEWVVKIPPGVLHGCRVESEIAHLFYITSHIYDGEDEGRIPYNDTAVNYSWGPDAIVVERDMRSHTPKYERNV